MPASTPRRSAGCRMSWRRSRRLPARTTTWASATKRCNQTDEAIRHYREAVRLNRADTKTASPWPALNLGILLRTRGELEEAESLFREALSYDRRFAPGYYQLGARAGRTRPAGRGGQGAAAGHRRPTQRMPRPTTRCRASTGGRARRPRPTRRMPAFKRLHESRRQAGAGAVSSSRRAALHCGAGPRSVSLPHPWPRRRRLPQDPLASQSTLQQIARSLERGDLAAASRIVEPALKAHPADPVLHNLAGVIAAQQDAVRIGGGALSRRRFGSLRESGRLREPWTPVPGARRRQSGDARQRPSPSIGSCSTVEPAQRRRTVPERVPAGARRAVCRQPRDARAVAGGRCGGARRPWPSSPPTSPASGDTRRRAARPSTRWRHIRR